MAGSSVPTRRPTVPIPPGLRERFYDCLWSVAVDGRWIDSQRGIEIDCGNGVRRRWMRRRHALVCLWLTSLAARFSELRRLRVDDLSMGAGSAFVTRSKHGVDGDVEVTEKLIHATLRWRADGGVRVANSPWVIPSRTGGQLDCNAFNRDAAPLFGDAFGLRLSSHCFRDTACQLAMEQAGEVRVVQSLLGHRSAQTTEHYLAKQRVRSFRLALFQPGAAAPMTDVAAKCGVAS